MTKHEHINSHIWVFILRKEEEQGLYRTRKKYSGYSEKKPADKVRQMKIKGK